MRGTRLFLALCISLLAASLLSRVGREGSFMWSPFSAKKGHSPKPFSKAEPHQKITSPFKSNPFCLDSSHSPNSHSLRNNSSVPGVGKAMRVPSRMSPLYLLLAVNDMYYIRHRHPQ